MLIGTKLFPNLRNINGEKTPEDATAVHPEALAERFPPALRQEIKRED
jgi:hypothetical protein